VTVTWRQLRSSAVPIPNWISRLGLAFDRRDNLFVANYSNPTNPADPGPSLEKFKHGSLGNVFPSRIIAGPKTHLLSSVKYCDIPKPARWRGESHLAPSL
jgi:hypothetical protein